MSVAVRFKCKCMAEEAVAEVPDRQPSTNIVVWVEHTLGAAVSREHRKLSPTCTSNYMEYVKIPYKAEGQ